MEQKKILIVEDEGTSRTLLTVTLEKAGYQVFQTKDGKDAFKVAKAVRPDLIISDVVMPQMDGNRLIRRVHESEFGKKIPFVVLTSHKQMEGYFELMDVEDFITKPFDSEDLILRIKKVFEKTETEGYDNNAK